VLTGVRSQDERVRLLEAPVALQLLVDAAADVLHVGGERRSTSVVVDDLVLDPACGRAWFKESRWSSRRPSSDCSGCSCNMLIASYRNATSSTRFGSTTSAGEPMLSKRTWATCVESSAPSEHPRS